jgi:hypothetical protein
MKVAMYRLGEEPGPDLSASTTAAERVAKVWQLTVDAYTNAGRSHQTIPRDQMPVRIMRRGDPSEPQP